jgi:4-diphosphocytidyl-2-C-methyl-D-erythritol kinase
VPLNEDNLVWRAAAALWKALGFGGEVRDVAVRLDKRIPMQAGLGGGSSDAAATLVALGRLWAGRPPMPKLRDLAATLGADVAFFLSGGTALGLGSGEQIYPLVDLPGHWVVLVIPPFGVSTREAYAWYDEERSGGYREPREMQVLPVPWPSRAARMTNDLEAPTARRHPEILEMKSALREAGAVAAAMSGSGSAVFGLFRDRRAASRALPRLTRAGWTALLTRTVNRAEYEWKTRPTAHRR